MVKAAYVLKSKSDVSGLSFDPRRPTVSPTMCGETSGEEEGVVGNEESSQSNDVGGTATGPVVAMAGDELMEEAKNGGEDVYSVTPGRTIGGETGLVEVAAGKEWVVPHIETALEDVMRKLRESRRRRRMLLRWRSLVKV